MIPWQGWILGWNGPAAVGEQLQAELRVWSLPSLSPSLFPVFPLEGTGKGELQAAALKERDVCVQSIPSAPCPVQELR